MRITAERARKVNEVSLSEVRRADRGGGMVAAPSPLVRMFRERYKPPPTTRSGAESQPLNDFAVL